MTNTENATLEKLAAAIKRLDGENKKYLIGVADGMAIASEHQAVNDPKSTGDKPKEKVS